MVFKFDPCMTYRVFDEFEKGGILKNVDSSYTVTKNIPENEWPYGYIFSFDEYGEVLELLYIRDIIRKKLKKNLKNYL
ncbi:hypothetical protein CLNEO_12030 [Anaerotignum neopropionicum]|uniref:Uncharacterized protein n=1 Tax=Anaerotignum neopropionicum TaxID=36847 RepID=A0A136WFA8_9FIRM|nr:hypothetical protein CLNEO_12030 [Anaerotignum neopropionicum]